MTPIVHLTYNEGLSSVFAAQVARPMSYMRDLGYPISLGVFAPIGQFVRPASRRQWGRQLALVRDELGLEINRLPSPPSRAAALWKPARLLPRWLRRRHGKAGRLILHCRGPRATEIALEARSGNPDIVVIFDCRGWDGAEYLYGLGYESEEAAPAAAAAAAAGLHRKQGRAAVESDAVLCVSQAMKRAIVESWSVAEDKIAVVPCCTNVPTAQSNEEAREAVRHAMGLHDKLVIAYSGSLNRYQMPKESLRIVKAILEMRPDAYFLALTTDPSRLLALVEQLGLDPERYRILSPPHQEVQRYLTAADAGLLIRDTSLVNRVASPVKFAEYLASGVPVLITGSIGDYSNLVRGNGLGAVLPDADATPRTLDAFRSYLHDPDQKTRRERCRLVAERQLSWPKGSGALASIYDRLLLANGNCGLPPPSAQLVAASGSANHNSNLSNDLKRCY